MLNFAATNPKKSVRIIYYKKVYFQKFVAQIKRYVFYPLVCYTRIITVCKLDWKLLNSLRVYCCLKDKGNIAYLPTLELVKKRKIKRQGRGY